MSRRDPYTVKSRFEEARAKYNFNRRNGEASKFKELSPYPDTAEAIPSLMKEIKNLFEQYHPLTQYIINMRNLGKSPNLVTISNDFIKKLEDIAVLDNELPILRQKLKWIVYNIERGLKSTDEGNKKIKELSTEIYDKIEKSQLLGEEHRNINLVHTMYYYTEESINSSIKKYVLEVLAVVAEAVQAEFDTKPEFSEGIIVGEDTFTEPKKWDDTMSNSITYTDAWYKNFSVDVIDAEKKILDLVNMVQTDEESIINDQIKSFKKQWLDYTDNNIDDFSNINSNSVIKASYIVDATKITLDDLLRETKLLFKRYSRYFTTKDKLMEDAEKEKELERKTELLKQLKYGSVHYKELYDKEVSQKQTALNFINDIDNVLLKDLDFSIENDTTIQEIKEKINEHRDIINKVDAEITKRELDQDVATSRIPSDKYNYLKSVFLLLDIQEQEYILLHDSREYANIWAGLPKEDRDNVWAGLAKDVDNFSEFQNNERGVNEAGQMMPFGLMGTASEAKYTWVGTKLTVGKDSEYLYFVNDESTSSMLSWLGGGPLAAAAHDSAVVAPPRDVTDAESFTSCPKEEGDDKQPNRIGGVIPIRQSEYNQIGSITACIDSNHYGGHVTKHTWVSAPDKNKEKTPPPTMPDWKVAAEAEAGDVDDTTSNTVSQGGEDAAVKKMDNKPEFTYTEGELLWGLKVDASLQSLPMEERLEAVRYLRNGVENEDFYNKIKNKQDEAALFVAKLEEAEISRYALDKIESKLMWCYSYCKNEVVKNQIKELLVYLDTPSKEYFLDTINAELRDITMMVISNIQLNNKLPGMGDNDSTKGLKKQITDSFQSFVQKSSEGLEDLELKVNRRLFMYEKMNLSIYPKSDLDPLLERINTARWYVQNKSTDMPQQQIKDIKHLIFNRCSGDLIELPDFEGDPTWKTIKINQGCELEGKPLAIEHNDLKKVLEKASKYDLVKNEYEKLKDQERIKKLMEFDIDTLFQKTTPQMASQIMKLKQMEEAISAIKAQTGGGPMSMIMNACSIM